MPDTIKSFSDIKLRDYNQKPGCQPPIASLKSKYTLNKKDELFIKYADNIKKMIDSAADNQQSLFRKIYSLGLNGQNRFKNWRTCLKTKRDNRSSDDNDREEEDGYLSNGSDGSGTRSDVSIDDDDSIYVEQNARQMAIMEERDIETRSKSKQLREDATQNDLSDTDEEDSNNGTQSVVVARNTNACRQATRQSPVRTRSTSRFTGATQRR